MDFEHCERQITLDENTEAELKKLADDGWGLVPGTKPIATYQLVRVKRQHDLGGQVRLGINDELIGVLKADGKMQ